MTTPTLTLSPNPVAPGANFDITGTGFSPKSKVQLAYNGTGYTTNVFRPKRDGTFLVGMKADTTEGPDNVTAKVGSTVVATAVLTVQKPVVPPAPTVPGAPTNVVASPGDAKALLSWATPADGGSPITGYRVYRNGAQAASAAASPIAVVGLTNGTAYSFAISAVNAVGEGPKSAAVSVTPVAPPPPVGKVVQFPGTGARTPAAFVALAADTTVDVIQWAAGTYLWQEAYLNVARPSARPLLVQPAPGAAVIWDGGGSANPAWRIGWNSLSQPEIKAAYITIDPAGTGGSFTAQNYRLSLDGLVQARYYDHVAVNGIRVRDVYGTGTPQTVHCVYLDHQDGLAGHRGQYWTSNNWDVVGPSNRVLCGFQIDHTPSHDYPEASGWTVENLHRWSYLWSDPTHVVISGWTGKNCNVTIDNFPNNAQGVVKNCHATNCGPLAPGKGSWVAGALVDGGGNTSA